jgi:hypothetical protein
MVRTAVEVVEGGGTDVTMELLPIVVSKFMPTRPSDGEKTDEFSVDLLREFNS